MRLLALPRLRARFRPDCETLEARTVPAVTASFVGGVITITGDDKANNIAVLDEGNDSSTPEVRVYSNGVQILTVDGKLVTTILGNMKGGNDRFSYFFVDGLDKDLTGSFNRFVSVTLGKGDDTFLSVLGEGFIDGGALTINVTGNIGDDHLANQGLTAFDGLVAESLTVNFSGNKGEDVLTQWLEEPDTIYEIDETSSVLFDFKGGKDADFIGADFNLDLDNVFTFKADGEDGNDTLNARIILDTDSGMMAPPTPVLTAQLFGGQGKDKTNVGGV